MGNDLTTWQIVHHEQGQAIMLDEIIEQLLVHLHMEIVNGEVVMIEDDEEEGV